MPHWKLEQVAMLPECMDHVRMRASQSLRTQRSQSIFIKDVQIRGALRNDERATGQDNRTIGAGEGGDGRTDVKSEWRQHRGEEQC